LPGDGRARNGLRKAQALMQTLAPCAVPAHKKRLFAACVLAIATGGLSGCSVYPPNFAEDGNRKQRLRPRRSTPCGSLIGGVLSGRVTIQRALRRTGKNARELVACARYVHAHKRPRTAAERQGVDVRAKGPVRVYPARERVPLRPLCSNVGRRRLAIYLMICEHAVNGVAFTPELWRGNIARRLNVFARTPRRLPRAAMSARRARRPRDSAAILSVRTVLRDIDALESLGLIRRHQPPADRVPEHLRGDEWAYARYTVQPPRELVQLIARFWEVRLRHKHRKAEPEPVHPVIEALRLAGVQAFPFPARAGPSDASPDSVARYMAMVPL
jgi:hypothetical protein